MSEQYEPKRSESGVGKLKAGYAADDEEENSEGNSPENQDQNQNRKRPPDGADDNVVSSLTKQARMETVEPSIEDEKNEAFAVDTSTVRVEAQSVAALSTAMITPAPNNHGNLPSDTLGTTVQATTPGGISLPPAAPAAMNATQQQQPLNDLLQRHQHAYSTALFAAQQVFASVYHQKMSGGFRSVQTISPFPILNLQDAARQAQVQNQALSSGTDPITSSQPQPLRTNILPTGLPTVAPNLSLAAINQGITSILTGQQQQHSGIGHQSLFTLPSATEDVSAQPGTASFAAGSHVNQLHIECGPSTSPNPIVTSALKTSAGDATGVGNGPLLYMPCDETVLAGNQILLRKQIVFFEATVEDAETTMSGRRKSVVIGQVGIRCRHCSHIPLRMRKKGSVYYPSKLKRIYQAAQNMNISHLCGCCDHIDAETKARLVGYLHGKSTTGHGGKEYWAGTADAQGVYETEDDGLRFRKPAEGASAKV